jgi:hypothetical protein
MPTHRALEIKRARVAVHEAYLGLRAIDGASPTSKLIEVEPRKNEEKGDE